MRTVNISRAAILAIAGGALALATTGGIVAGQPAQPVHEGNKVPAGDSPLEETAKTKLAAAERACNILHDMTTGDPRGHEGVEHTYLWSKRRMEAQIDVDRTKPGGDGGIAAIQRHTDWMRQWRDEVVKSGAYSGFDIASAEYYVAEAEDLLAGAKAK